jgi:hypothetical protein
MRKRQYQSLQPPWPLNSSVVHIHAKEPVLRNHLASVSKLLADGRLEEVKTILGWTLDTRRLLLSLQTDKHKLWSAGIRKMITDKSSRGDKLNTVGRLKDVSFTIPAAQHFLGRICHFEEHYYPTTKAIRWIPRDVLEDLTCGSISSSKPAAESAGASCRSESQQPFTAPTMCFTAEPGA